MWVEKMMCLPRPSLRPIPIVTDRAVVKALRAESVMFNSKAIAVSYQRNNSHIIIDHEVLMLQTSKD